MTGPTTVGIDLRVTGGEPLKQLPEDVRQRFAALNKELEDSHGPSTTPEVDSR